MISVRHFDDWKLCKLPLVPQPKPYTVPGKPTKTLLLRSDHFWVILLEIASILTASILISGIRTWQYVMKVFLGITKKTNGGS